MTPVIRNGFVACYLVMNSTHMEERDDLAGFIRSTRRLLREYVDLRLGLLRLQAIRTLSRVFSLLMVTLVGFLMGLFVLLFLGFALSAWVAGLTDSPVAGHLTAAGFFLILLILGILLRKPLFQAPLIRMFIAASAEEPDDAASEDESSIS
jgi:hypothetical protein